MAVISPSTRSSPRLSHGGATAGRGPPLTASSARSAIRSLLESVCEGPDECAQESVTFGIVPGAFYREHKNTGANGERIAAILRGLGVPTELVPVRSFGRLEENARIINDWLRAQQGKRVA